jgi:hypothetical protein
MSLTTGPARPGDVYRFDRYSQDAFGRDTQDSICMDARDEEAALYEAEYILNMNTYEPGDPTGKLWRVDSGTDVFVADVGPLDFGGAR